MPQFSLEWEAHKQTICHGLSALQQNGEFVDMTLAADGHHVKVHQMIMSLASPYIKDLILSAQCPHPVIFLNKVSYTVLCAILEYIYTGEMVIDKENLSELIQAGKELHIKGLEDVKFELSNDKMASQSTVGQPLFETGLFESPATHGVRKLSQNIKPSKRNDISTNIGLNDDHASDFDMDTSDSYQQKHESMDNTTNTVVAKGNALAAATPATQYTISNQGTLQMILNRNLYYLVYTSKRADGTRTWKCINYMKRRTACPATVYTREDIVVKRLGAHNHPFHDKQILRKVRDAAVYERIVEAEEFGFRKKAANLALPDINSKRKTDASNKTIGDSTTDGE